jgi:hypothetical protein
MKSSCGGWNKIKSKSNDKVAWDIFIILLGLSLKYNMSNLKIVKERGWLDKLQRGRLLNYFQSESFWKWLQTYVLPHANGILLQIFNKL